ncbi:hypothetical protein SH2C18_08520 [Clostridium sediminicola]|uniref:DUF6734 family protein n=1 Tax=Clostridium sediminicola TaxID=3114879 RepID=UPI0031F276B6
MKAFHSNWTKPFFVNHPNDDYFIEDFDLLVGILSALKWKEKNGSIKMYTDDLGGDYYYKLGLTDIYDLGVEISLEKIVPKSLNPYIFWAGGKLYALREEDTPSLMLDLDFIIWESISDEVANQDVCIAHRELLEGITYPNYEKFKGLYPYDYDDDWDWKENPCNTALAYFADKELKDYFVRESIKFMNQDFRLYKNHWDRVIAMVFAEQRLLAMCAKKKGIKIGNFISNNMDKNNYCKYTHIWGYKNKLLQSEHKREEFCKDCVNVILRDFPSMYDILCNISSIQKYLI